MVFFVIGVLFVVEGLGVVCVDVSEVALVGACEAFGLSGLEGAGEVAREG